MAEALTPAPPGWPWDPLADEILENSPDWASLRDRAGWAAYADALQAYAERRPDCWPEAPWRTWTAATTT